MPPEGCWRISFLRIKSIQSITPGLYDVEYKRDPMFYDDFRCSNKTRQAFDDIYFFNHCNHLSVYITKSWGQCRLLSSYQ